MPDNVRTARTCLVVAGCLFLATAVLAAFILVMGTVYVGWSGARNDLLGNALLGLTGFSVLAVSAAAGIACFLAARSIRQAEPRGRILGLVLGLLMLPLFPVGTVLGGFVLAGLLGRAAGGWFAAGPVSPGRQLREGPPARPPG